MVTSAHPSRNNSNGENNGGLTLRNFKWVLILLEIPILKYSVIQQNHNKTTSNHAINKYGKYNTPQIRALSYEILKRCIGYLSCVPPYVAKELIYNLQCWDDQKFNNRIDLINLYITFHANRIIYHALPHNFTTTPNKATLNASDKLHSPTLQEFEEGNGETSNKDASSASGEAANENVLTQAFNSFWCGLGNSNNNINTNGKSNANIPKHFKLSLAKYGFDWHLQTAAQLLIYFFGANQRTKKCFVSHFYNTLLDFIDYKKDFETWKKLKKIEIKHHRHNNSNASSNLTVFDSEYRPRLTLCQYPFLLSLGIKVLMMEYEAKKVMEQKAEEAFLNAIGSNKIVDVYFRIKIRRDHITQDSLRCISSNNNNHNLHKSLKVEFIDEPGLDAGGLKKEWFLLLTSKLFNPTNGLFVNIDESNLFWFSIGNPNGAGATRTNRNNNELYYLFGVVLGLAIFNSTILDLNFPLALYKKLCGEKLTMQDYIELYPESGKNLMKLFNYNKVDFTSVFDLYFETCYQDCFGTKHTVELRPNGSKIPVTNENKADFVYLWMDFYLNKSILDKFNSFTTGFIKVVNGDSFKLFSSEELEQLCCGSTSNGMNSGKIDIESLKTITKYAGSFSSITGRNHKWDGNTLVIQWFWEIFKDMTYDEQKKLLQFVTGSHRLPATGASSMIFRITRLGPDSEHLPLAHTCFNELCLYEYKTKEKLKKKILFAIQETEGYGFR
ncbi:putative E3 ubiquitin-protein ligase HUL4 SCDLUD_003497 [Saccharomycodes ludwigii]|uniref:putative E3 ubiquitin-protein ligase HUL4 n=1 Tax=Saccharomycodes ludwigii TaxID=36035 RepID=UPI001E867107|nr:hypothetical protein SCDLUD_003497 [Saccharomycodes ludwigii]KAH3900511.1 hypothetical protein SCDLUD_003497 [Saccharomycodes ludwigii]